MPTFQPARLGLHEVPRDTGSCPNAVPQLGGIGPHGAASDTPHGHSALHQRCKAGHAWTSRSTRPRSLSRFFGKSARARKAVTPPGIETHWQSQCLPPPRKAPAGVHANCSGMLANQGCGSGRQKPMILVVIHDPGTLPVYMIPICHVNIFYALRTTSPEAPKVIEQFPRM